MLANYGDTPEKRRKSSCYEKFEISKNVYKIVTMWQIWATGNVFSKMTGKKMKNLSKKYTLLCKMLSFSSLFYISYIPNCLKMKKYITTSWEIIRSCVSNFLIYLFFLCQKLFCTLIWKLEDTTTYFPWFLKWNYFYMTWICHCVKIVQIRIFLPLFSRIQTEYRDLLRKSPYSVRIRENKDHKKLRIWTLFPQCVKKSEGWSSTNILQFS